MTSRKWQGALLLLLVLLFSACSKNKTKLVTSLSDPAFDGPAMQRVLVVGVMNNGLNRHVYEDTFVDALKANGVDAVASHTFMPKFEDFEDKAKLMATVHESNADHVLLAVLMNKQNYKRANTGQTLDSKFQSSYSNLRNAQRTEKNSTVQLETTIFLTENKARIWAGSTKSFKPDSVQIILDGNTKIIMEELKKVGLLP